MRVYTHARILVLFFLLCHFLVEVLEYYEFDLNELTPKFVGLIISFLVLQPFINRSSDC